MARSTLALLALAAFGCRAEATQLIVVVDSDIAEVTAVEIFVEPGDTPDDLPDRRVEVGVEASLPFSFGVAPREGIDPEVQMPRLRAVAYNGATELVERRVQVGFVKRKTLYLLLYLAEACRGVTCPGELVCDRGECVAELIDPSTLQPINPRDAIRFDAGGPTPRDASFDTSDAPLIPGPPQIRYPWNGVAARSVEVTWQPSAGSRSSQLEIATECMGTLPNCTPRSGTLETSTGSTFLLTATDDVIGRRYIRARACRGDDGSECGDWSETRYFDLGRTDADTDGDGLDDIVAGAPGYGDRDDGQAWWYANLLALPVALGGGPAGAQTGGLAAFVGDVDADGAGDVVVGSDARFDLYAGRPGGVPTENALGLLARLAALKDVAGIGDIDGDGFADMAACNAGTTRIFFGPPTEFQTLEEPAHHVAGLGDLDGDGLAEFAISVDESVVVYRGSATRELTPMAVLTAPTLGRNFGDSVVSIGDRDDDLVPDFVVGAPDFLQVDGDGSGAAYFVSGASVAAGSPLLEALALSAAPGQHWGASVAALGDGYVVGGPGGASPEIDGELVYVTHSAGSIMQTPIVRDPIMGDRMGTSACSGDYSGDGSFGLLSGAPFGGDRSDGSFGVFTGVPPAQTDLESIPDPGGGVLGLGPAFGTALAQAPPSVL